MTTTDITTTSEWARLAEHADSLRERTLRELFSLEETIPTAGREAPTAGIDSPTAADRVSALTFEAGDLVADVSKNLITPETAALFAAVAEAAGVAEMRDAMFRGEHINRTEDRAVLHTALRLPSEASLTVDGQDVVADVHDTLRRASAFANAVRSGEWTGATGEPLRTIVNIGIGGSDLGPVMVAQALRRYTGPIEARFVSNIDPADLVATTADLDPATTLFIVSSKTFTTQETMTNATAARRWLVEDLAERGVSEEDAIAHHFAAVSTNLDAVEEFGISDNAVFGFWDWVGGRYSVDSAIGLSVLCAVGPEVFRRLLDGFHTMDEHFRTAPFRENLPVQMALLNIWYSQFFDAQSRAVLPYIQDLARFPAYLQQLTMESNGKSVHIDGTPVTTETGQIWWGEPGTNGQHAFFQLLHQGTRLVPADFIGVARPTDDLPTADGTGSMHDLLMANFFAQTKVLAFGKTSDEVASDGTPEEIVPHKVMPGNRPTTTILAPELTAEVVGQLIALYEHIVAVEGIVYGINSFDQWGVELGKKQAGSLLPYVTGAKNVSDAQPGVTPSTLDPSTAALLGQYRAGRASTH